MNAFEPPAEEVMTYKGLSAYLKMAPGTLRHYVMRGIIPCTKIGINVRFTKKQIDAWLESQECRRPRGGNGRGNADAGGGLFPAADSGVVE